MPLFFHIAPVQHGGIPQDGAMAEIINFNKARKQKARADAEAQAAENRVRHGRTKQQKQRDADEAAEAQRRLEQLRRERPDEDS